MRYVFRKLGFYLIAAWVALTINFLLPRLIPGNPVEILISRMSQSGTIPADEDQVLTSLLGLGTGNIFQKYWQYLDGLAHLQLGLSITDFPTPVSTEIASSIYWTLILVGTATVISWVLGIVLAARASGERAFRIILVEILPNELPVIVSNLIFAMIFAILTQAGLAFIGLGDPTMLTWGNMLNIAYNDEALSFGAWWWFIPPGACIALLGMGLALINFGLDEVLNPRLRVYRPGKSR